MKVLPEHWWKGIIIIMIQKLSRYTDLVKVKCAVLHRRVCWTRSGLHVRCAQLTISRDGVARVIIMIATWSMRFRGVPRNLPIASLRSQTARSGGSCYYVLQLSEAWTRGTRLERRYGNARFARDRLFLSLFITEEHLPVRGQIFASQSVGKAVHILKEFHGKPQANYPCYVLF